MATLKAGTTIDGSSITDQIPPIGTIIGMHPDCTVTPNATFWLYCDGATGVLGSNFGARSAEAPPNLTDSRFLMGSTAYGSAGSNDTPNHAHTDNFSSASHTLTTAQLAAHSHTQNQHRHVMHGSGTITGSGNKYLSNNNKDYSGGGTTDNFGRSDAPDTSMQTGYTTPTNQNAGSGNSHSHTLSGAVTSSGSVASGNIPLYFKVKYYIRIT